MPSRTSVSEPCNNTSHDAIHKSHLHDNTVSEIYPETDYVNHWGFKCLLKDRI